MVEIIYSFWFILLLFVILFITISFCFSLFFKGTKINNLEIILVFTYIFYLITTSILWIFLDATQIANGFTYVPLVFGMFIWSLPSGLLLGILEIIKESIHNTFFEKGFIVFIFILQCIWWFYLGKEGRIKKRGFFYYIDDKIKTFLMKKCK